MGLGVGAEGVFRGFIAVQWYEVFVLVRRIWQPNRRRIEGMKGEEENLEINQSRHDLFGAVVVGMERKVRV